MWITFLPNQVGLRIGIAFEIPAPDKDIGITWPNNADLELTLLIMTAVFLKGLFGSGMRLHCSKSEAFLLTSYCYCFNNIFSILEISYKLYID